MLNWKAILSKFSRPLEFRASPEAPRQALVKSRPLSLRERYCEMADDETVETFFRRLQHRVYREVDRYNAHDKVGAKVHRRILRETGRLNDRRPFFFVQPVNEAGWLFEKGTHGWRISRAQRIVSQQTFMRQHESWDVVTLHTCSGGGGPPRVDSLKFKTDLVSYAVYEQQLLDALGLNDRA